MIYIWDRADCYSGDMIISEVLGQFFHPAVAAALAVGVAAAAMSTTDSILLALGSIFSRDVYVSVLQPVRVSVNSFVLHVYLCLY
jgi:Na+/proline symporter